MQQMWRVSWLYLCNIVGLCTMVAVHSNKIRELRIMVAYTWRGDFFKWWATLLAWLANAIAWVKHATKRNDSWWCSLHNWNKSRDGGPWKQGLLPHHSPSFQGRQIKFPPATAKCFTGTTTACHVVESSLVEVNGNATMRIATTPSASLVTAFSTCKTVTITAILTICCDGPCCNVNICDSTFAEEKVDKDGLCPVPVGPNTDIHCCCIHRRKSYTPKCWQRERRTHNRFTSSLFIFPCNKEHPMLLRCGCHIWDECPKGSKNMQCSSNFPKMRRKP